MALKLTLVLSTLALAAGAVSAQTTLGKGGSLATGGAGPNGQSQGANDQLERCDAPKGTLAVVEPQSQIGQNLQRYGLGSPTAVIRTIVQQSNCFQIVERGVGMGNMMQERGGGG
ncbi:MAG TPA: peptidoglycan-binding protein, partial [Caldimonas sp.]|nr:peptidoglycan-binding protein [Caldimonas sp.]